MTRGTRRWIRTAAVAAICANVALLYAARPARAASTCPLTLPTCEPPGTCSFSHQVWDNLCETSCQQVGGSTCHQSSTPVQCEIVGSIGCAPDAELYCHCHTT
jgi:hypothetical protein